MKHLLVAIDFSKSSDRALAYAEEIALKKNARISLVHVHSPAEEKSGKVPTMAEKKARLTELAESVKARRIDTEAFLYEGTVVETLRRVVDEGDCDLVVMGCQGENFHPENPWGSTTTSLMEDTRIPILAIPAHAPVKYPHRFVLATDGECPRHVRLLSPLLDFLEEDRPNLLLYHTLQDTEREMPDQEYARLLSGIKHRFFYEVDDHQPVGNAMISFADLVSANLLAVMHRVDHKPGGSIARRVAWTAAMPILILQDSY